MSFAIPRYREPDFTALGLDGAPDVKLVPAERDGVMPRGYHATTLFPEYYHIGGRWVLAEDSRMDCVAVVRDGAVSIVEFRNVKAGELVVVGRTEDGSFPFGCSGRKRERPGYGFGGCGRFFACHGIHSSSNVKGNKARADSTTVALQAPHRISRIGAPCLFSVSAITCRHAPQGEHSREAGSEAIASARTFRPLRFDCT